MTFNNVYRVSKSAQAHPFFPDDPLAIASEWPEPVLGAIYLPVVK